jgi:hypothetical protein
MNGCFYDMENIECTDKKCSRCGWNPCNTVLRKTRIKKLKERMVLNARNKSNTKNENL